MKDKSRSIRRRNLFRRKALALAIGTVSFSLANTGWTQATSGTIYGTVPVLAGETIQITGGAGFNRSIEVSATGKYSITLPVGTYTESPRESWRLQLLREWSHEQDDEVFPRGARTCGSDGA